MEEQMNQIKKILMERDGMSASEAEDLIMDAKADLNERLADGEMPLDICEEWFGIEPDFIDELI
jgi:hypothetical protein